MIEAQSTSTGGTDYVSRSRPLSERCDELHRYRSWPPAGEGTRCETRTPAERLETALADDIEAAAEGLLLGRLAGQVHLRTPAIDAPKDRNEEINQLRGQIERLHRDARALRRKVAVLEQAVEDSHAEVDGESIDELSAYQEDLNEANKERATKQARLESLQAEATAPKRTRDEIHHADFSNVAWVIAALRRTAGHPADPRLATALRELITDLRLELTPDRLSTLVTATLVLPLADGGSVQTSREFTVPNNVVGGRARPAGRTLRNTAIVEVFLREAQSIEQIAGRTTGALEPAQIHRALAQGLNQLLPGRRQGARRYLRNVAGPRYRQAAWHALHATPAEQRPAWLSAEYDLYLEHLAQVLRNGHVTNEDVSGGLCAATLRLILDQPDPTVGVPVAEVAERLHVRAQRASTQAVNGQGRLGPHPATLAKVTYYDATTNAGTIEARMRPIRCAHIDCPAPWASALHWTPEILVLGTGVICPECRRPSRVAYHRDTDEAGETIWTIRDEPAADFPIPDLESLWHPDPHQQK